MQNVIVILGPTATGKSSLAVKIARKHNGEIISADSRQVYIGLDIGTGKITKKESHGVPHYLINVAKPKNKFTVTKFQKLAQNAIEDIIYRGKVPIICGGTGFYIDAITKGIVFPEVPPNHKLRKSLSHLDSPQLMAMLKKLDKNRAQNIDPNNKVRIMRAIEIAQALGKVPKIKTIQPKYNFLKIGLMPEGKTYTQKVTKRVKNMFENGLLKEIKKLQKSGVSNKRLKEFGFEYFEPTVEKVVNETIKYSKRQMTWFKRDEDINWFYPNEYKKIEKYIKDNL